MPSRTKKRSADDAPPPVEVDATSNELVLAFVGGDVSARNVPARDLTHADIARLTYVRSYSAVAIEGKRPDPRRPDPEVAGAIVADLVAGGLYTTDLSKAAPLEEPPATETPDEPAEQPED